MTPGTPVYIRAGLLKTRRGVVVGPSGSVPGYVAVKLDPPGVEAYWHIAPVYLLKSEDPT